MAVVIHSDRSDRRFVDHCDAWVGAVGFDCDGVVICDLWFTEETDPGSAINWPIDGERNLSVSRSGLFSFFKAIRNRIDGPVGHDH